LDKLVNVEKLWFASNKISKLDNISHMSKLRILELGANRLSSIEHLYFCRETLEELYLGKNRFSTLSEFKGFSKLRILALACNRLRQIDLVADHGMVNLHEL